MRFLLLIAGKTILEDLSQSYITMISVKPILNLLSVLLTPRQGVRGAVHGIRGRMVWPYLAARADFSQQLRARPTLVLSMFVCGSQRYDFRLKTLTSVAGCRNSSWNQRTEIVRCMQSA